MAKNNNSLSRLSASSTKLSGLNPSKLLTTGTLFTSGATGKPPALGDSSALSMSGKETPTGIQFGKPANSKTTQPKNSNTWTSLLTQSSSGGIAGGLSGLGSIVGLGGLFSSIASLFGGGSKSTPPPLVDFQLPTSVSQTVYISSKGSTAYQGTAVEKPNVALPSSVPGTSQSLQYQSAAIAQAVKKAMLTSSSLNDVIAEI
jgi:hypothetical protein